MVHAVVKRAGGHWWREEGADVLFSDSEFRYPVRSVFAESLLMG